MSLYCEHNALTKSCLTCTHAALAAAQAEANDHWESLQRAQAENAELRRELKAARQLATDALDSVDYRVGVARAKTPAEQAVLKDLGAVPESTLLYWRRNGSVWLSNVAVCELARRAEPQPALMLRPLDIVEDRTEAQLKADGDWIEPAQVCGAKEGDE
jgi:hypothetical protein